MGEECSREILHDVLALPIRVAEVTSHRVFDVAHIRAQFPVSHADAFADGLAREMGATVITGDPEFERVKALVDILWL